MPSNPQNVADAFFGTSGQHDLLRYGRALFPDLDEQRIGQTVEQERASGKPDHAILGEGVEMAKQRLPREWAGRAQQIQQKYQDEVQRQQALSAERARANSKWKILAGLGQALAGRDPQNIAAHFDQLEQLNLQGGLRQAEATRDAGLQSLQFEQQGAQAERQALQDQQQATLFQQGQEDRARQQAQLAAEDDPNSEESRIAQELARRVMNRPAPGLTATKFKQTWPQLEKVYQIEQQRLNRQDSLAAQNAVRADAKAERNAAREDAQTFRADQADAARTARQQEQQGKTEVPGFGFAHDEVEARDLRQLSGATNYADQLIDELIDLRTKKGGGEVFDRTAVRKAEQNAAELRLLVKDAAKLGVLSSTDYTLLNQLVPEDPLEFNPVSTLTLQGDPTMEQLKQLKQNFARRIQQGMAARLKGGGQPGAGTPDPGSNPGRITVTNGQETLEIDAADLQDAEAEGYRRAP